MFNFKIKSSTNVTLKLAEQLSGYNLSKPEFVQICNLMPKNEVELQLLIPNIYDRLTEVEIESIIESLSRL